MSTEVTLPALGESVTEGTVSRWLKNVGDTVDADEPIVEISTDKVDTEIPAPAAGIILEIRVPEDETCAVGGVLAVIGDAAEAPTQGEPPAEQPQGESGEPQGMAPDMGTKPKEDASDPTPVEPEQAAAPEKKPGGAAAGTDVTLPALGESVNEGTVSRWLKAVGEQVEADEPLVEVSTDKVDTEIPSPVAGTLLEIRVNEDEVCAVGGVLGVVGDADAVPAAEEAPAEKPTAAAPQQEPKEEAAQPTRAAEPQPQGEKQAAVARRAESAEDEGVYVTPLVRKMAEERGVDLSTLVGTGVGGRIRKQDVLAAAEGGAAPAAPAAAPKPVTTPATQPPTPAAAPVTPVASKPAAPAPAPAAPAVSKPATSAGSSKRGTTEKMSRLRATIAKRMVESLQVSAQLTATVEVDMTEISKIRKANKESFKQREGVGLSYLPFITKVAVELLKDFPQMNATIDTDAGTITYHDVENVGIAVDTEKGLLVPVVRNAGDLSIAGIARKIVDLADRTRNNQVTPDELAGGTFTITNYGSAGALFDTPIINQPQVAILGTGALVKRPIVISDERLGDSIVARDMMYLSLSYDHRLIDGAVAARFLSALKARLEEGDFDV